MNTKNLNSEVIKATSSNSTVRCSVLKTGFLFFMVMVFSSTSFAQNQFLWTGGGSTDDWTDASNWDYYPYATSDRISPAPFYPGQGGLINPEGPKNDIAIFNNLYDGNCDINASLRVGGIIIEGYTGTLTQINGTRFNVSESDDAGGEGFWDGSISISSGHSDLIAVNAMLAYQARFNFGGPVLASNGFQGGAGIVGGISPSYGLLFAVPLTVENGTFKAPEDETRIRHNATFANGLHFDNSRQGTVVLSNRSAGMATRFYNLGNVHFWDLKVTTNGADPATKEFSGAPCIVENNFMTAGSLGVLGTGSDPIIMNAPIGTEIHIKNDLIVGNVHTTASFEFTGTAAFGNLFLVMNGNDPLDPNQHIRHPYNNDNFSGILPSLKINKPLGNIILEGPTTFNNQIQFIQGILYPTTASTQDALTDDVLVLNTNTSIAGASDASHCNGAIRVRTGKELELPIGKSSLYRPALIKPISGISTGHSIINMYSAEYFDAESVESVLSFETPTLSEISPCEVWAIQKYDNSAADPWTFNLELNYNSTPCFNHELCELAVTRWDLAPNQWVSHGNSGLATTTLAGAPTIRTAIPLVSTDFERSNPRPDLFTFGKLTDDLCSPCEVDVCVNYCFENGEFKFDPIIVYGGGSVPAGISWDFGDGTSTDLNPTHTFISEGIKTISVEVCAAIGADTCCTIYNFQVINTICALPPTTLERQPQTQKDAKQIRVSAGETTTNNLIISPNPSSTGTVQFSLKTTEKGNFEYQIVDHLGERIKTGKITAGEPINLDSSQLAAGSYWISIQFPQHKITKPFVVTH
ncbi:T9SS type A sorting domain-containing protein [Aureispira anguillae]|uniref:T9SS type A sorting domain-containing protein n=1 Tax=Aureispira anguillae TaxID=2864201 RepID=A0A915YCW3_9BACT|nr:T9SS type A sorting domain-containing protein [Aureispira anguillae]BDS10763.1 T9SS type A sorting domain-containing protein [Aureispira anguillae]